MAAQSDIRINRLALVGEENADHVMSLIRSIPGFPKEGIIFRDFMPVLADASKGFIAVRKAGKLPPETVHEDYALEYGTASIEIETSAIKPGDRVLVVDDLIATGGTAKAAADLIEKCGGTVAGFSFVMELEGLPGTSVLAGYPLSTLVTMPA